MKNRKPPYKARKKAERLAASIAAYYNDWLTDGEPPIASVWSHDKAVLLNWGDCEHVLAAVNLESCPFDAAPHISGSLKWTETAKSKNLFLEPYSSWLLYIYEA